MLQRGHKTSTETINTLMTKDEKTKNSKFTGYNQQTFVLLVLATVAIIYFTFLEVQPKLASAIVRHHFARQPPTWRPDWVDVSDMQKLFDARNARVREVCRKHEHNVRLLINNTYKCPYTLKNDMRMLTSIKHRLSVCLLPKAASTFWTNLMKSLGTKFSYRGTPKKEVFGDSVNDFWSTLENPAANHISDKRIAYFTRNPWHRFVSVYLQKVSSRAPQKEKRKFLYHCSKYRESRTNMDFEEFLRCAVLMMEDGEFNRHWEPVFTRCDVCSHAYTHPISFENMQKEAGFLLTASGVPNSTLAMDRVRTKTIRDLEKKKLSSNFSEYYSNLMDKSLIHRFSRFYSIEMEMFGYPNSPFTILRSN